jgi:4,5-dihydroxyphthalate decarboxylase
MTTTALTLAVSRYPHTAALLDGEVGPAGREVERIDAAGQIFAVFRDMARSQAYDVAELGVTTAVCARVGRVGLTPLPVFLTRRFDHEAIAVSLSAGVEEPADLEGRAIGVRAYSVTDAVWACGVLADVCGLDLGSLRFLVTGEDHVAVPLPPNVAPAPTADLNELVRSGQVAAVVGYYGAEPGTVRPLFDDLEVVHQDWVRDRGYVPIHHVVALRDDEPALDAAADLYRAFVEAKEPFLDRLARGDDVVAEDRTPMGPVGTYGTADTAALLHPDPVPYGLEANRGALDDLFRYLKLLRIVPASLEPEDVFASVV